MSEDVESWIEAVEQDLLPGLRTDARFVNADALVDRFTGNVARWRDGGQLRAIIEDGNELAAAAAILKNSDGVKLHYEPALTGTRKTIDFGLDWPDGTRSWVDVKTVAPQWIDNEASWVRFQNIAADMPENAHFITRRDMAGAATSGQEIKARWSFVARTVEVEVKAALLTGGEVGPVRLLLCSNGGFHRDGLEDFADYYRTGNFRQDDWARNAVARHLVDEGITLKRSLAGFAYLHRDMHLPFAREWAFRVLGPVSGR